MKDLLKKMLVVIPVLLLTILFLKDHYREEYRHAGAGRLMLFGLTILILYGWILLSVYIWKQRSLFPMLVQSSFFVYVFMVLTLTGYFILFREISAHGWWTNIRLRIQQADHVNLKPFQILKIYKLTDKQVVGNFIMLLPLGVYLPLLYKKLNNFSSSS
jgi:glycopeptide antibiotics resistance protein